ncbi:MAG: SUMF1/EgtB/PvdO family nonheme iron enzyme, partial [Planctomycetota bacterium]
MVLSFPAPFQREWMLAGRYEVTQEEFGQAYRQGEHDLPVSMINFHEAQAWCQERNLRLPNVWEWNHLATSGTGQFSVDETSR